MGKGDKRTAKGKRFAGSYGKARLKKTKTVKAKAPAATKAAPVKAPVTKKK